jgi:hypothetical protein
MFLLHFAVRDRRSCVRAGCDMSPRLAEFSLLGKKIAVGCSRWATQGQGPESAQMPGRRGRNESEGGNQMKNLLICTALAGGMALSAAQAVAQIRAAPGVPPAHPSYSHTYVPFLDYIVEESDDALSAVIIGPEVVNLAQMRDALESELAQVGLLLPLYFPADLPYMSNAAEVALVGVNPHAMASAMSEYIVTCEPCQEELRSFGIVYLGSGSTNTYHFLTRRPVESLADLDGLRLRSGGAPWSRWAESAGAVAVNLPVGETFEAFSQGTVDGTMTSLADLLSFRLVEVATHINTRRWAPTTPPRTSPSRRTPGTDSPGTSARPSRAPRTGPTPT